MKIAVDCEFNGFGGELISMALVAEDGREWYMVRKISGPYDPWVAENVVPKLVFAPVHDDVFRSSLHAWLMQFDNPTIVADWYTDLVHFFNAMAGNDHFTSLSWSCQAVLNTKVEGASAIPHNALEDARGILREFMN